MGREIRRARYLSEIRSMRELREARRELELREWFARERLAADVYDTFTIDNLVAMVAPPGSTLGRIIGGVGTGFAAVRGVMGVLGSMFGGMFGGGGQVVRRPAVRKRSAVARKRTPELEVEVELEKPRSAARPAVKSAAKPATKPAAKLAAKPAARSRKK